MKPVIVVFILLFSSWLHATDLNQAYQEGNQVANSHATQPIDLLKNLDVTKLPGYEANLPQQNYYGGVTQKSTKLTEDANSSVNNNVAGKSVTDSFNNRTYYQINNNSATMQKLHNITDDADQIMHGQSTDKVQCSLAPQKCQYSWQDKTCVTGKPLGTVSCTQKLKIEVQPSKKEYWDGLCVSLQAKEKAGICQIKQPLTCIEPTETRVIDGVSYTRSCWKQKAVYECGNNEENTCTNIIAQGCEQKTSTCIKQVDSTCLSYQQTYQCPLTQCTESQIICGDKAFCLEGDCSNHDYTPADDLDFKKAMSSLSAASEASKQYDSGANFIFKGQRLECSRDFAGAANCCRDSGWGIDMHLFHCNDMEKQLGKAKENQLVVATGEYCAKRKKFPGGSICISHHQTYCVFQSKLARIIQVQGRLGQLSIGFGSGQYSNCSGITPQQMQLINFENINFSEFYQDVQNRLTPPDYQKTSNGINRRMKEFFDQGDVNG